MDLSDFQTDYQLRAVSRSKAIDYLRQQIPDAIESEIQQGLEFMSAYNEQPEISAKRILAMRQLRQEVFLSSSSAQYNSVNPQFTTTEGVNSAKVFEPQKTAMATGTYLENQFRYEIGKALKTWKRGVQEDLLDASNYSEMRPVVRWAPRKTPSQPEPVAKQPSGRKIRITDIPEAVG